MVTHMKTTIELPDSLLSEARRVAEREGGTLRSLIEEGLRKVLADHRKRASFKLRDCSVAGEGLASDVPDASWEAIRDRIYEGRGA